MKTLYYTATSLDGYIADEHNSLDWLFQFDADEESDYPTFIRDVGAVVMGSTTYEWVLDNHVYRDPDDPGQWPYEQPTWVFSSRSPRAVPGADIRFVRGDVRPVHEAMRAAAPGKNIWVAGGGDLAGQFFEHGLLDEIILHVAPVLLCRGAPLFTRPIAKPPLEVLEVTPQPSGMTRMRLAVQREE